MRVIIGLYLGGILLLLSCFLVGCGAPVKQIHITPHEPSTDWVHEDRLSQPPC